MTSTTEPCRAPGGAAPVIGCGGEPSLAILAYALFWGQGLGLGLAILAALLAGAALAAALCGWRWWAGWAIAGLLLACLPAVALVEPLAFGIPAAGLAGFIAVALGRLLLRAAFRGLRRLSCARAIAAPPRAG